jgi:calcineurin-like phosphoesterase family protein
MKKWLTADLHLGEDRFEVMGRPFTSRGEMIDHMAMHHNFLVKPEDEVYVVGDVCYQKTPEFLHNIQRFNGIKTLIRGNHDRVFTDEQLEPYFVNIIPDGGGIAIDIQGIPCYITHYPTEGKPDRFNLVGHIHTAWKYQLNMFNVGVDVNHFRPVDLDRVPFHLEAVSKYYDQDVWVAYGPLNAPYVGKRGKAATYFRPLPVSA